MESALHVPVAIVPRVVMFVVPTQVERAVSSTLPNPKLVLAVEVDSYAKAPEPVATMNCPSTDGILRVFKSDKTPVVLMPPTAWDNPPEAVTVKVSPVRVMPLPTAKLVLSEISMLFKRAIVPNPKLVLAVDVTRFVAVPVQ